MRKPERQSQATNITVNSKLSSDICIYCGSTDELSVDHIPPKNLFPKPRPSNLITVPSCRACNEGASKDDEYFRLMISMRHDTGDHPAVRQILPTIYRSLQKPKKKGFQQSLFKNIDELNVFSKGGIYLGRSARYNVDLQRLNRVVERITKGLYFHEFNSCVPESRETKAFSVSEITFMDQEAQKCIIDIWKKVIRSTLKVFGNKVFAYWFQLVQGDPTVSAWVLLFYEKVWFLCFITPKENMT
jgi:hypothetical protein